jgi:chemotaxis response regulator CheB
LDDRLRLAAGPVPDVILLGYSLPDSIDLKLLETILRLPPRALSSS